MADKEKCFDAAVALTIAAIKANSVPGHLKTDTKSIEDFLVKMYQKCVEIQNERSPN